MYHSLHWSCLSVRWHCVHCPDFVPCCIARTRSTCSSTCQGQRIKATARATGREPAPSLILTSSNRLVLAPDAHFFSCASGSTAFLLCNCICSCPNRDDSCWPVRPDLALWVLPRLRVLCWAFDTNRKAILNPSTPIVPVTSSSPLFSFGPLSFPSIPLSPTPFYITLVCLLLFRQLGEEEN